MEGSERDAWREADRILAELLEIAPDQRAATLAQLAIDADLRTRVQTLLSQAEQSHDWLDQTPSWSLPTGQPPDASTTALAGHRLGPWLLESEIGRGGMAVVYRARRSDGVVQQSAAVKVLTIAALGRDGSARFRQETQILARLEHPHIVGLIDAGVEADGTPWLAMPLVEGERIDHWCRKRDAHTRLVVGLVLQVCAAIAHAHRQLVVHRDIKPSNVLVDAQAQVRLLDFGIARLVDQSGEATVSRFRALTPGYAAPEQFQSQAPSTAMDVFGLGALLHQLLTGVTPVCDAHSGSVALPSQQVADDAVHGRAHRAALARDLDRVLVKALATDPARRYGTVDELAGDLQRWLDGRPVLAQLPGLGYRLRKFVHRHRAAVAGGLLLMALLAAGIASLLWQAERTRQAAERALAVTALLSDILRSADPTRTGGDDPRVSELLQQGAAKIRKELADQPMLQAELLLLIGQAQLERASLEPARDTLDAALSLYGEHAADGEPTLHARTLAMRASVAYELGNSEDALEHLNQGERLLLAQAPGERELLWHLRAHQADQLLVLGRAAETAALARRLIAEMTAADQHETRDYFFAQRSLGAALGELDQLDASIAILALAIDGYRRHFPDDPALAATHNERAIALLAAQRTDEAESELNQALALQRRIYGENHPATLTTLANLAVMHLEADRTALALDEFERVHAIETGLLGDVPHPQRVSTLLWLALARYQAGDTRTALGHIQAMAAMLDALPDTEPASRESARIAQALIGFELGRSVDFALSSERCASIDQTSRLTRWACLAQALQAADRGACPAFAGVPSSQAPAGGIERRWLAVHWLLHLDCDDNADPAEARRVISALAQDSRPPFPTWLQTRITDAFAAP